MVYISKATKYNWEKLNSENQTKLTKRANKTQSAKRFVASHYLDDDVTSALLHNVLSLNETPKNIMYSLCLAYLEDKNIIQNANVSKFVAHLNKDNTYHRINIDIPKDVWNVEGDVLGFIYQSIITEGEKNLTGQYYTNKEIVNYITNEKHLASGETLLDPCCGSGAFLLSVSTDTPECLYGFDINPIAVMIACTNLLVKYADYNFNPNIFCIDFLKNTSMFSYENNNTIPYYFDNIYTNPPWGADKKREYCSKYSSIKSKERSSMVIAESLGRLRTNGNACFILPVSILTIKTHNDIRKHILSNASIQKIDLFENRFDGVFTNYFCIKLTNSISNIQEYDVRTNNEQFRIKLSKNDIKNGNISIVNLSDLDYSIIEKLESKRHDDLKNSEWALGIVTGNNKEILKTDNDSGLEPIFTGKQVYPFKLKKENTYISFAPNKFQQCAKEEMYRAKEKLIYRFIAKYPIVAYDDKQSLCLNSANILIPKLKGISVKSVVAFLNSTLYRYYYSTMFNDIKVLKSNLQKMPFPKITKEQDSALNELVTTIHNTEYSEEYQKKIDNIVYSVFGITEKEEEFLNIKIRKKEGKTEEKMSNEDIVEQVREQIQKEKKVR